MPSKGTTRLANILSKRMHSTADYHNELTTEQGKIIAGRKLKVDTLGVIIPRKGYKKASGVSVSVGNRVVVSWASGEPVIVARIKKGGAF